MARYTEKSYRRLFAKLTPRDRRKVNEAVIWAVNCLTDLDGIGRQGTKAHIEARAKQLILDYQKVGWGIAAKRFRNAIAKRRAKGRTDTLKAA